MANLTTHYKERLPEETVQIIKDFFRENKYILKESNVEQTEAGTWFCRVDVFKDEIYIYGANGKGMTREYALASGYAELYERFCNKIYWIASPLWRKTFIDINKKEHGYNFAPDEKLSSYDEYIKYKSVFEYFDNIAYHNPVLTKKMIDFFTDGLYIQVPLYNIGNKEDKLYLDPRLLLPLVRSNGMAAGNTLEEALVQACSELMERDTTEKLLYSDLGGTHYAIALDKIDNPNLQEKIKNIQNLGYDLYLFDLSYSYNMPVMMSLLLDRKMGILKINFGSFPVFDIAAERVITELYQGIKSFRTQSFAAELQIPYKSVIEEEMRIEYGNSISGRIISTDFFKNIKYVDTYNHDVFVDKNSTNDELVKYYYELSEKLHIKFYYINNSLSDKVCAVHVITEPSDESYIRYSILNNSNFSKTEIEIQQCIEALDILSELYNNIYYNRPMNFLKFIGLLYNLMDSTPINKMLQNILLWNYAIIEHRDSAFNILYHFLDLDSCTYDIPQDVVQSELITAYRKYTQLVIYVTSNLYSLEEILHIFNDIFNYNITEEDAVKCTSPAYLLQKAYIEPCSQYIHSDRFYECVRTYTDNCLH